ncbi:ATP-binding SpoIIE family protein phosphatase [Bowdeniella nasicola]|uniref:ATP-binding SpoIIE family protein phosphatase n=1 Tax=Bowdeniella nasicola TaxID=208480 RepID=UPI000939B742|nr:ATP-binding SpoIIE family protein phosphatase [Bowdeniella nasicola]
MINAIPVPSLIVGYRLEPSPNDPDVRLKDPPPALYTSYEGWGLLWCNEAFEECSGWTFETLKSLGVEALRGVGGGYDMRDLLDPETTTIDSDPLLFTKPNGDRLWTTISFRRLPGTHEWPHLWLLTCLVTPGAQVFADDALAGFQSELERQANLNLSLAGRVSELLSQVPAENVLAAIADLLKRNVLADAEFMALRRGQGLVRSTGFIGDRLDLAEIKNERWLADPVLKIWGDETVGTTVLTIEPGTDPELPSAAVFKMFATDPNKPVTVMVTTASPGGRSRGLLISQSHAMKTGEDIDPATQPTQSIRSLLNLIVRRVSSAMENYELFHREHVLAESLQRSMLPSQDSVSGLDVWTYYQPYSTFAHVGGDWYDIETLSDGRVSLVLGDAVGNDVEAVMAMHQIRTVIHSVSDRRLSPAELVNHVDAAISSLRLDRTASLVVAVFEQQDDDSWLLRYTRAGHVPGVLVGHGRAELLGGGSEGMLGYPSDERTETEVRLHPGEAIVLYTDGIVERRGFALKDALEALCRSLGESNAPDAAGLGEEIMDLAEDAEDDISVVVLRVPGGKSRGPGARARRWQLPSETGTAMRARDLTARVLAQWGLPQSEAVLLAVSELVSNAVMHGWGTVGLRLKETDSGIRIEVEDANPTPPRPRLRRRGREPQDAIGGYGLHVLSRLGDWGWRPTSVGKVVWARIEV